MIDDYEQFIRAMQANPEDTDLRLVFADYLEEHGDPRAELCRLQHMLTQSVDIPDRPKLEDRLRSLVAAGVQPVGPFFTDSIGMKFAWIPPGTFLMGSPASEEGRDYYEEADENQHKVTLTRGFYLGIHQVTQEQWQAVMENNPSLYKGEKSLPVEEVSWEDCQEFLKRLSEKEGHVYRLPSEAEWEYACRAGTTTPFYFGETISTDQVNYDGNYPYGKGKKGIYRQKTTPVGSLQANGWGLYDMHGNVWEWCADWYGGYPQGPATDPQGPETGEGRVLRGGSFLDNAVSVRSADRYNYVPTNRFYNYGFRVARTLTA